MAPERGAGGLVALFTLLAVACSGAPPAAPTSTAPLASPTISPTALATPSPTAGSTASPTPAAGSVEAVRAELERYVATTERTHQSLFSYVPEADWRAAVQRLDDLIPELVPGQPERLMVEFVRLAALPGVRGGRHGHASAEPPEGRPALAIVTYSFAEGIFVTRARSDQQNLIGARVNAVAGRPIDEVVELITPLVKHDNEWTAESWLIDWLRLPEVLVGLGLIEAVGPVEFELEFDGGDVRTVEIPLLETLDDLQPAPPPLSWATRDAYEIVVLHYLAQRPDALWTSRLEPLWWTVLDDGVTLYVQQNLVEPPAGTDLDAILAAARDPAIERVVLDLRHNLGGDPPTGSHIYRDPAINQPGRLYVITSHNTYSAATFLVEDLDKSTDAVFVGEPMGGAPEALFGSSIRLGGLPIPLSVGIPTTSGQISDRPLTVAPDIPVPLTAADYFGARDAALEAILAQ